MSLTHFSLTMNFRFGLVAIFLIFNVVSVRSSDNDALKKEDSNEVQLSSGIMTNPFLQSSINNPNIQNNPFLRQSNGNKNGNPFLSNAVVSQVPDIDFADNLFLNNNKNPLLNSVDLRVEIASPNSSRPITQTPPPYYHVPVTNIPVSNTPISNTPVPNTPLSNTPMPNISVFNTPATNNDFTTSHTTTPSKIHPPISHVQSMDELVPIKISPLKTTSEIKCDEYAREIAGKIFIASRINTSSDVRELLNINSYIKPLVVNGTEAQVNEFPHMVALGIRNSKEFLFMCGGTLISHTWILTAAHCTHGPNGGIITDARIGFHSLTDNESVMIVIKDVKTHPDYKPTPMYADIALILLMDDVTFGITVQPACLYQQNYTVPRQAWVSGWGTTEYGGEQSNVLQKAELNIVDNLLCTLQYNNSAEVPYGITSSMICAGLGDKDTCQGDSGGPLQITNSKNRLFFVIGITSFGQGCAMNNIPGVYTRVSHYLTWIENIVWPQGQ